MQDAPKPFEMPGFDVEELFRRTGVLREGHFLLTSGLHSAVYWEKFSILRIRSMPALSVA